MNCFVDVLKCIWYAEYRIELTLKPHCRCQGVKYAETGTRHYTGNLSGAGQSSSVNVVMNSSKFFNLSTDTFCLYVFVSKPHIEIKRPTSVQLSPKEVFITSSKAGICYVIMWFGFPIFF